MQNDEYDVIITLAPDEEYPMIEARSMEGCGFLGGARQGFLVGSVDDFIGHVPPGLRVGLLNPETNIFVLLPTSPLH